MNSSALQKEGEKKLEETTHLLQVSINKCCFALQLLQKLLQLHKKLLQYIYIYIIRGNTEKKAEIIATI